MHIQRIKRINNRSGLDLDQMKAEVYYTVIAKIRIFLFKNESNLISR